VDVDVVDVVVGAAVVGGVVVVGAVVLEVVKAAREVSDCLLATEVPEGVITTVIVGRSPWAVPPVPLKLGTVLGV
jgi:hypothetical protein